MSAQPIQLERRSAQRFDFHLAVSIATSQGNAEASGFTQNISARGAFFYTELELAEGDEIHLSLVMPSEVTLAENMQVKCRGRVRRVSAMQHRFGVAVCLEGYEFMNDKDAARSHCRVS